jgi:hypothetical protein
VIWEFRVDNKSAAGTSPMVAMIWVTGVVWVRLSGYI